MPTRRQFLLSGAAALAAPSTPPRNMIVLMVDEHNPKYSAPYGHPFVDTPNLTRLARRGTVFTHAYCASPLCMPSRSSFMTGRRVFEIQTYGNCNVFPGDYPSYGKVLADQGVHTVHIGKTDVYNQASALGFSEMIRPQDRKPPGDVYVSRKPFDTAKDSEGRGGGFGPRPNPFQNDLQTLDAGLAWLKDKAPSLKQPWTLAINLVKPHFPHYVTPDLWEKYAAHADLPQYGVDAETARHPSSEDLRKFFETSGIDSDQTRNLRRGYYGCVSWVDSQLGRLLDTLEQAGRLNDTVVAYTSDHGEMLGKFGMWWKRSMLDDSARVPLIVAGPGFSAGKRVETPVDHHDLRSAMFRATGAKQPDDWCGTPLQNIAANDTRRVIFSEFQGGGTRASAFMIRQGRWKLLYNCEAPKQLFDLKSDPEEVKNLAASQPKICNALEAELRKICDPEKESQRADDYAAKQLKAIGRSV